MSADALDLQQVLQGSASSWVEALPEYQRSLLEAMLANQSPSDVAISWLATSGPRDTAPFGGVRAGASLFYDKLLSEIEALLCNGERYETEREDLKNAASWTKMGIVSFIALIIGPHVGASAVVIAPAVAMILAVLSNAGKATACEGLATLIADRELARIAAEAGEVDAGGGSP